MSETEAQGVLRDKDAIANVKLKIEHIWRELRSTGFEEFNIMHVCGTHEHTITYFGLRNILPKGINLIAGPGCPVCVAPTHVIDNAVKLALEGVTVFTFGDMFRVPGSEKSLMDAKAEGGDVRIVFGFLDALKKFSKGDFKEGVFLAVGFETTAPTYASRIVSGKIPKNFSVLTALRITVPATKFVLSLPQHKLHGVIAPGHVSVITGANAWSFIPNEFKIPVVVSGFEPLDVMLAVLNILESVKNGSIGVLNEYSRVVTWDGNKVAKKFIGEAFDVVDGDWRGIGIIPESAWELKGKFKKLDAERIYGLDRKVDHGFKKGCKCAEVILGLAKPTDCALFGKGCTPQKPYGPCMVSIEGTCYIWYKYGRKTR